MNFLIQIQMFLEPVLHDINFVVNAIIFGSLWAWRSDEGIKRKWITVLSVFVQLFSVWICIAYLTGMYLWQVSFLEVGLSATFAAAIVSAGGNLSRLIGKKNKDSAF